MTDHLNGKTSLTDVTAIRALQKMRTGVTLSDQFSAFGPVIVDEYFDPSTGLAYQVSERTKEYRVADGTVAGPYGAWIGF